MREKKKNLIEAYSSVTLPPSCDTFPTQQVGCDVPGLFLQEYFPYICFHINANVLEIS